MQPFESLDPAGSRAPSGALWVGSVPWRALCALPLTLACVLAQAAPVVSAPVAPAAKSASSPAKAAHDQGLAALAAGNAAAADTAFREAVKQDNQFVPALLGLAELAFGAKRLDEAGAWIDQALKAQPGSAAALSASGRYQALKGKMPEAEAAFRKAMAADPGMVRPRIDLADTLAARRDFVKSAALYKEVLAIDAKHAGARFGLGQSLLGQDKPEAAVVEFKLARELMPDNVLISMAMARAELARKNADAALSEANRALKAQPGLADALLLRGDALDLKGSADLAVQAFAEAARSAPNMALPHLRTGMVEQQRGRVDAAVQAYQKAIGLDPRQPIALNNLASIAAERKQDLKQAEAWARQAVAAVPRAAQFHDTLGMVQRAQGNLPAALKAFEAASRLSPRDATLKFHLGRALAESSDKVQARKVLQEALTLSPSFPEAAEAKKLLASM